MLGADLVQPRRRGRLRVLGEAVDLARQALSGLLQDFQCRRLDGACQEQPVHDVALDLLAIQPTEAEAHDDAPGPREPQRTRSALCRELVKAYTYHDCAVLSTY